MTPHCPAHAEHVPGCRECCRAWLDRKPVRHWYFDGLSNMLINTWRDFEPQQVVIVECVGGYRAVVLEHGPMDLAVKEALTK